MSYSTQSDVEAIFGPANVAAWSRFELANPTGPADAARIASALAQADAQIDAHFAGGPYALPLVCGRSASIVTNWSATLAGVWLYGSRTTASYVDYALQRYLAMRNNVYQEMDACKAGVKRLDAAMRYPHATGPSAMCE